MKNYQVFISYRRDGGEGLAGRIADRLNSLGYCVFFDVESMRSGTFNTQIYDAIDKCNDFVLILPPNGLDRCSNEEDWVRKEITYAVEKSKNIIPVMMRGFEFPDTLPSKIEIIRYMEGVIASNDYFDAVINKLQSLLKSEIGYKKIVDEIMFLTKQYNWSHGIQVSDSGMVFINYAITGLSNIPKVRFVLIVDTDDSIFIIARNIIDCTNTDKAKLYELICNMNKRSFYAKFEIFNEPDGDYIQARYEVHKAIINRAGVSLSMIEELSVEVNRFYPEMEAIIL